MSERRSISVVTVNRADYAIILPVIRLIEDDPALDLRLMVAGSHLSPEFGRTEQAILEDGFQISSRVEMLLSSDTPEGIAKSIGLGTIGFAQEFARSQPDMLLVSADRFEMFSAAIAAIPFRIPTAHIEGGDLTEGLIDEPIRHSVTKISHLHFVSTDEYRRRVIQLGEEPWRVTVSGAPSLDSIRNIILLSKEELERKYGFSFDPAPLLVTLHPVTLEFEHAPRHIETLLAAIAAVGHPAIFTLPNADTSGRGIIAAIRRFVSEHTTSHVVDNLGTRDYLSVMTCAAAMVGNSSSGIIEAPSFKLPVVNIGARQRGRTRAANVIDVDFEREEIERAIRLAISNEFRATLYDLVNPYGDGDAASRIVERIKAVDLTADSLLVKRFYDLPVASEH